MKKLLWLPFLSVFLLGATEKDPMRRELPPEILKIRDPFQRPAMAKKYEEPKSDLEIYPVEKFKMVGVITGPDHMRAMVMAPNGKTYVVSEKQKIGVREGFVRKITTDAIVVQEKLINVLGEEEKLDNEIRLPPEKQPETASPATTAAGQ